MIRRRHDRDASPSIRPGALPACGAAAQGETAAPLRARLSVPGRDPRGDRPALGPQPDRRGVLRRPGLAPVPPVGAGLPDAPGGRAPGAHGRSSATSSSARSARRDRSRGRHRRRREPRLPARRVDRPRSRHRADPARGLPRRASVDGRRLAWAEAESLPFDDATFDACWTVGGFNYFRDHEAALREMRRVTRPGGPVVVADEIPGLHRAGLGPPHRRPGLRCLVAARPGARPRVRRHGPELRRRPRRAGRPRLAARRSGTGSGTGWATVSSSSSRSSSVDRRGG